MKKFEKYLTRKNTPMPKVHLAILEKGTQISADAVLQRTNINQLFNEGYLPTENGFHRRDDGATYVAVLTKMPKVSLEMIDWWFWWHAAEGIRYQLWYPSMHFDINADFGGHYNDTSKSYRERLHLSEHLVSEDVGMGKGDILIDFKSPKEFGFDENKLDPKKTTIICARVGLPDKGVWFTEMCHFVRVVAGGGVEMRSRFWMGNRVKRMGGIGQAFLNALLNQSFIKRNMIPQEAGSSMFHHCSQEYHNMSEFLPQLYREEC